VASPAPPRVFEGVFVHLDADGNPRIVERHFVVSDEHDGYRLDHYLKRMIPRLSRTRLQDIIRTQMWRSDGKVMKPSTAVAAGEKYVIRRPARPEPPCPRTFTILHDDAHMMVIDKPAGLPVHVSAKFYFNTLTRVMSERFPDAGLQICHRLDRETSGILVVARGKRAAAALKGQFSAHTVRKTYLAIVAGQPPWDQEEVIDLPLGLVKRADALIAIRMEVRDDAAPASTLVRVRARHRDCALVECVPITGRQHQIRAHLAAVGYPIIGDKLYLHGDEAFAEYCDTGMTDELRARFVLPRHALHAASIRVRHPDSGELIAVDCPLPDELRAYLER
jgi:23S rRNA pseudouridine1911/1915/1917 synthase